MGQHCQLKMWEQEQDKFYSKVSSTGYAAIIGQYLIKSRVVVVDDDHASDTKLVVNAWMGTHTFCFIFYYLLYE